MFSSVCIRSELPHAIDSFEIGYAILSNMFISLLLFLKPLLIYVLYF
jgi:hypothetical protein